MGKHFGVSNKLGYPQEDERRWQADAIL